MTPTIPVTPPGRAPRPMTTSAPASVASAAGTVVQRAARTRDSATTGPAAGGVDAGPAGGGWAAGASRRDPLGRGPTPVTPQVPGTSVPPASPDQRAGRRPARPGRPADRGPAGRDR